MKHLLTTIIAAICCAFWCSGAQPQHFYRIVSSNAAAILSVDFSGTLTWSNTVPTGSYIIERTSDLANGPWEPITRGEFSNRVWSVRVHHPSPPSEMAFIPGGRFQMGDSMNDPLVNTVALPVHTVYVKPFFIDKYEVNNEKMRRALQWGYDHNMFDITTGSTGAVYMAGQTNRLLALNRPSSDISFTQGVFSVKAGRSNYPAVWLSWFGAVAYCNFLSALEGKELCYDLTNWTCDFTKKGYRLPTEAEWEIAARGGHEGLRFPWPDTNVITHARANYRSNTNNWYDVSPTRDFHPTYTNLRPRTNPVDDFPPNNYGLHDMAGNNWEWVWDWHGRYPSGTQHNPTGPVTGINRIFRGGSWFTYAERVTCAMRYPNHPLAFFEDFTVRAMLPY